ncbi:MAG TPA: hypothetical protein VEB61_12010 [Candidatus Binatia bacterium]|nr:hypothetical protein [Candidatus Binatia bacterium]
MWLPAEAMAQNSDGSRRDLADTKPGERVPPHYLDKPVGIEIQDVAAENLVYHKALERNVGATVEVEPSSRFPVSELFLTGNMELENRN